jgi:hypothetical protein
MTGVHVDQFRRPIPKETHLHLARAQGRGAGAWRLGFRVTVSPTLHHRCTTSAPRRREAALVRRGTPEIEKVRLTDDMD